jgi:ADAM-TS Spacer 1
VSAHCEPTALLDANGTYVLNGNFIVSAFQKEIHVSGSILEYTGSGTAVERLSGTGMLHDDIFVYVHSINYFLLQDTFSVIFTV